MISRKHVLFVLVVVVLLIPSAAFAQDLNFNLEPTFGETSLSAGFVPDPFEVDIVSGGSVEVFAQPGLPSGCTGYAAEAPDFSLFWEGDSSNLRFFVSSNGDTTLIVNDPATDWFCDDDSDGTLNPTVDIANPLAGRYDIWVGSFSEGDFINSTLYITELDFGPSDFPFEGGSDDFNGGMGGLDFNLEPNFGEAELAAGFLPDPFEVELVSGGDVAVFTLDLPSGCTGYATEAPDFSLFWEGDSSELRFFVSSGGDTTLIVNDPATDWFCNDDSDGTLNPTVSIEDPLEGRYDIWVGSFSSDDFLDAVLYVTELDFGPSDFPMGN
ncbi:MAG: hypothetical protein GYB67_06960 [Chloroflexi bacterium]|nr:hypothetical protein [Chloroflexota bacterium]